MCRRGVLAVVDGIVRHCPDYQVRGQPVMLMTGHEQNRLRLPCYSWECCLCCVRDTAAAAATPPRGRCAH
eukprot:COSAG01_NODE_38384_length_490_cov_1.012788_1_plen_69_part_10